MRRRSFDSIILSLLLASLLGHTGRLGRAAAAAQGRLRGTPQPARRRQGGPQRRRPHRAGPAGRSRRCALVAVGGFLRKKVSTSRATRRSGPPD